MAFEVEIPVGFMLMPQSFHMLTIVGLVSRKRMTSGVSLLVAFWLSINSSYTTLMVPCFSGI